MADFCSLKNHGKFRALKNMSGLPDFEILDRMNQFVEQYGRFPEIDELPNVNSSDHLKGLIKMKTSQKGTNYSKTTDILTATNTSSIQEANAVLNNMYRDLNIKLIDIGNTTFVDVKQRPSEFKSLDNTFTNNIPEELEQQKVGLFNSIEKLRTYYGVDIHCVENDDVVDNVDVSTAKGFIKDGSIYINLDNATIDTPIHEMLHMFLGSLSISNPTLFFTLIQTTEQLPTFQKRAAAFGNSRTMSDIQEEIFVEELAKFLTGRPSMINNLSKDSISYILYNIKRDIDTIINGNYSVKSLEESTLFDQTLRNLAEDLESESFNIDQPAGLRNSEQHRILANVKSDLIKTNQLEEICE